MSFPFGKSRAFLRKKENPGLAGEDGGGETTSGFTEKSLPGFFTKNAHPGVPPKRTVSPPAPPIQCCLMAKQTPNINGRFLLKPSCTRILHNNEMWGAGFHEKTKAHTERWAFFVKNPDSGKSILLHAKHTRVTYVAAAHTHTHAHKGYVRTTNTHTHTHAHAHTDTHTHTRTQAGTHARTHACCSVAK